MLNFDFIPDNIDGILSRYVYKYHIAGQYTFNIMCVSCGPDIKHGIRSYTNYLTRTTRRIILYLFKEPCSENMFCDSDLAYTVDGTLVFRIYTPYGYLVYTLRNFVSDENHYKSNAGRGLSGKRIIIVHKNV